MTSEGNALLSKLKLASLNDTDIKGLVEVLMIKLSSFDVVKNIPGMDWSQVRI